MMRYTTIEGLTRLRRTARRRGAWFRKLSQLERGIVELTIRYVDTIRSTRLALAISRIICKLLTALQSPFLRDAIPLGAQRVAQRSRQALAWGHQVASSWIRDGAFIRFLGVTALNDLPGWRTPS
jgi:hypothetical protein